MPVCSSRVPFQGHPTVSHRPVARPLSIALALVTGALLAQLLQAVIVPASTSDRSGETAAVVRSFYDAANTVLRTGDAAAFDAVLAPEYVDDTEPSGWPPNRDGLVRKLLALRVTVPGAWFSIDDLIATGDRVVARVSLMPAGPRDFLGATLDDAPRAWSTLDSFRVLNDRVIERDGDDSANVFLEELGRMPVEVSRSGPSGMALQRAVLDTGDQIDGPIAESLVMLVENGVLVLQAPAGEAGEVRIARGAANRILDPGERVELAADDVVMLPDTAAYSLRNDGPEPATVVMTVVTPAESANRTPNRRAPSRVEEATPWPVEIPRTPLAGGTTNQLTRGEPVVAIGQMTLGAYATLPALVAGGPVLLTVVSGAMLLGAGDGIAWLRDGESGDTAIASSGMLAGGYGAFVPNGARLSLTNIGNEPVVVLVVVFAASS